MKIVFESYITELKKKKSFPSKRYRVLLCFQRGSHKESPRQSPRVFLCAFSPVVLGTNFPPRSGGVTLREQSYERAQRTGRWVQCPMKKMQAIFFAGSHIGATILHPNTKVLDFQGLFVFLGVKNTPPSPLHLFPDLMDSNLRLYENVLKS